MRSNGVSLNFAVVQYYLYKWFQFNVEQNRRDSFSLKEISSLMNCRCKETIHINNNIVAEKECLNISDELRGKAEFFQLSIYTEN